MPRFAARGSGINRGWAFYAFEVIGVTGWGGGPCLFPAFTDTFPIIEALASGKIVYRF